MPGGLDQPDDSPGVPLHGAGPEPVEILFLNARDSRNPEGGGSEIYVEVVARALAAGGNTVTIRSGGFPGAPREQDEHGVRVVRGGGKLSVFGRALAELRSGRLGSPDVVVDVQNAIPFSSPLVTAAPTVVLVHHVHREQWPVVYGPLRSRIGWWVESAVAPRVYRGARYVAVSESTRSELAGLGVDRRRVEVIHNGVHVRPGRPQVPSPRPRILVLGRLVPHKQVEHVLRAAATLRGDIPDLTVSIVGDGWWAEEISREAQRLGVRDLVEFHGFLDDEHKQDELAKAWVLALPSLKEGWGLVITEAASHAVPSVAYRAAGGVTESILDGTSGILVDGDEEAFTEALRTILLDEALRSRLSAGASRRADSLSWQSTADRFAGVLADAVGRAVRVGTVTEEPRLHSADPLSKRRTGRA